MTARPACASAATTAHTFLQVSRMIRSEGGFPESSVMPDAAALSRSGPQSRLTAVAGGISLWFFFSHRNRGDLLGSSAARSAATLNRGGLFDMRPGWRAIARVSIQIAGHELVSHSDLQRSGVAVATR